MVTLKSAHALVHACSCNGKIKEKKLFKYINIMQGSYRSCPIPYTFFSYYTFSNTAFVVLDLIKGEL